MYYKQQFMRGELEVKSADGKVTRISLRFGNSIVHTRRTLSLIPRSFRNVITVTGTHIVIQEDKDIDDKLRWLWNEGIQIAFKYY